METVLPTMRVPEMGQFLIGQVFGARAQALPSNLAYTDRANTFTQTQYLLGDARFGPSANMYFSQVGRGITFVADPLNDAFDGSHGIFGQADGGIQFALNGGPVNVVGAGTYAFDVRAYDGAGGTASTPNVFMRVKAHPNATPAAGFGSRLLLQGGSTTTNYRDMGAIDCVWSTATDATRKARMSFFVYDTAAREALRLDTNGSVPSVTLFGSSTAVKGGAPSSTTSPVFTYQVNASGTPAAGFGMAFLYLMDSSTTANQNAAECDIFWVDATHATRKAAWVDYVYDAAGGREVIRREADGSNPMIGFLGAGAVVRQNVTGVRTGTLAQLQTVVANLLTALANLGLITDSTT